MNNQPPISAVPTDSNALVRVHSIYKTIQGEGPFIGRVSILIRLMGCNLKCPSCDTEYTKTDNPLSVSAIFEEVKKLDPDNNVETIILTGGEPLRQSGTQLTLLIKKLATYYDVQIETNGTILTEELRKLLNGNQSVFAVVSPKVSHLHPEWLNVQNGKMFWKYVISHHNVSEDDGLPIHVLGQRSKVARPVNKAPIYVQPEDTLDGDQRANDLNMNACVKSAFKYGYRTTIQMHKILGLG